MFLWLPRPHRLAGAHVRGRAEGAPAAQRFRGGAREQGLHERPGRSPQGRRAVPLVVHAALRVRRDADLYEPGVGGRGEAQRVAAVLAAGAAPRLRELFLDGNRLGDEGAARLAEALQAPGALPALRVLSLLGNGVGDEGAARLAEALRAPGAVPQLAQFYIQRNRPLGETGRAALRAAWMEAGRWQGGLVL
ncbi:unnamed protein product [Prorocentrum cordatum]|uniref:Uncharacterized protein n=1 Tax=Prorocentrum cordatum TaxID=2364126 RepID=A0ABN9W2G8_9DINO|nr:unnamed protein product [Polarella glacialis]